MLKRKGILSSLFGRKEQSSCCNMQIVDDSEEEQACYNYQKKTNCCDAQVGS